MIYSKRDKITFIQTLSEEITSQAEQIVGSLAEMKVLQETVDTSTGILQSIIADLETLPE